MFDRAVPGARGRKPYENATRNGDSSRCFQTPEIFGDLSVQENMLIPALRKRDGHSR